MQDGAVIYHNYQLYHKHFLIIHGNALKDIY